MRKCHERGIMDLGVVGYNNYFISIDYYSHKVLKSDLLGHRGLFRATNGSISYHNSDKLSFLAAD